MAALDETKRQTWSGSSVCPCLVEAEDCLSPSGRRYCEAPLFRGAGSGDERHQARPSEGCRRPFGESGRQMYVNGFETTEPVFSAKRGDFERHGASHHALPSQHDPCVLQYRGPNRKEGTVVRTILAMGRGRKKIGGQSPLEVTTRKSPLEPVFCQRP